MTATVGDAQTVTTGSLSESCRTEWYLRWWRLDGRDCKYIGKSGCNLLSFVIDKLYNHRQNLCINSNYQFKTHKRRLLNALMFLVINRLEFEISSI